jgi:hypothetical protein
VSTDKPRIGGAGSNRNTGTGAAARQCVNVDVFAVGGDAHGGRHTIAVFDLHRFANWILPRPIFLRHPMIHDDDFRTSADQRFHLNL